YHTIEHRGPIPPDLAARAGGRVFGCDACQDVCPWNRRAPPLTLVPLRARTPSLAVSEVLALSHAEARRRVEGTPLLRAGRDGLVRPALAIAPRTDDLRARARELIDDPAPGVAEEARRVLSEPAR